MPFRWDCFLRAEVFQTSSRPAEREVEASRPTARDTCSGGSLAKSEG